ncbi:MAG: hypothetical protein E7509_07150 [Ruminococcus sp.]|nr:hypothetical protein [Ruminococcus sp.]
MSGFFKKRQHPIKIIGYTTKLFWLLLIPLARSLIAVKFNVATWLAGWWLDMIVVGIMFLYAFFRWFFVTFEIRQDEIYANTGFFGFVKVRIPYSKVCTVSCSQGLIYRAFGAYNVYIDTNSGNSLKSDLKLTVNGFHIVKLKKYSKAETLKKTPFSYSPRKRNMIAFSFLFSSTLSGIILFLTLIIQSSRIVGRELETRFFDTLNSYAQAFAVNLPYYVVIFAMVVFLGWLYSFSINMFRHFNFEVTRTDRHLIISSGAVTRRFHILSLDKINYIDIQQSLLMKVFKICSVHLHCTGYGKSRREIAVLIPVTTVSVVEKTMGLLLPEIKNTDVSLRPRVRNIMRFLWPPIWLCLGIPTAAIIVAYFVTGWSDIIRFVALMLEIPSIWLLIVKASSIFTTGVGINRDYATFSYCRFYKFHKVIVNVKDVSKISIYQTPMQYLAKNASFKINTHGESNTYHTIKNFPLIKAQRFYHRLKKEI